MRVLLVVVSVCFVGSYADYADDIRKLQEETKRIEEYRRPCLKEVGLYADPANGITSQPASSPTIGQIFCLWACLYRKNGSIRPDGSVDEAAVRSKNPELEGPLDVIISKCENQAGENTCKLAGCLAKAHFNLLE
ncbi:uncharacterized protein LOC100122889 [Nasonia vitripennis]|uniref:Putative odorant binding protein 75 n=1 Tax=Nasonia vitripennis TaxID=7425 RepID=G8B1T0_NASVI|nr:uncharacterized protein LOC100122889 [Nasonia vitripennis]CCD17844.1 putative odorant binding protein 75 [Nasonia vitripennis]